MEHPGIHGINRSIPAAKRYHLRKLVDTLMKATRCRKLREHLKEEDPNSDENDDSSSPPQSYLSNTPKEAECLSHLATTVSKDSSTVPQVLVGWLLSARNEYGTAKPLPTYLRLTLLPHPNLYDLRDLLQFVFRHVRHESWLVEEDTRNGCKITPTTTATSPNQTLKWRAGDSLDQSILLASLLLGAGYDAYVVVGMAPDWLRRGETDLLCIGNDDDDWRGGQGAENCGRFGWRGIPFTEVPLDGENGNGSANGLHAWVMVRPGRRCDDGSSSDDEDAFDACASTIFADPAVGRIWSAEDDSSSSSPSSPYSSIHTIWNQSNQWIRLSSTDSEACAQIPSYIDLEDESIWRPLYDMNKVHVPASWAEKIEMPVPFPPTEHRVELYAQAKLELSPASRKLTRYDDEERTEETEAIEVFQGRLDHLLERQTRTTSPNQTFTETFSEFHPAGLRQWTETLGVERIIEFHLWIRADGLVCRKENYGDEKQIIEEFRSRPDGLTQRIIRVARISEGDYAPKGASILNKLDGEEIAVIEIEEHYGDLDDIKARLEADNVVTEQAVTSRIFHLVENRISVKRIYHDGVVIVSNTEDIKKEQADVSQHALIGKDDEGKEARDNNSTAEALIAERDSISSVTSIHEDMLHLCRVRCNEERKWLMEDEAPASSISSDVSKGVEEGSEAKPNTEQPRDYLEPFLIGVQDVDNIPPEEAERIKEACLGSLKDRLLQRAQIMQSKLDEEKKEVGLEEESRDDKAASRIRVWEQRLEQHETRSLDKFVALQERLNSDERLQRTSA